MKPEDVLTAIARYAGKLSQDSRFQSDKMAAEDAYVRVSGLGYRSVSLNGKTPLCRYAAGPATDLDQILGQFEKSPIPMKVDPAKKTERCLQRYIIKASLRQGKDMRNALALTNCPYDRLTFVTDEISLGDVRCDILALGTIGADSYPVIVELKSNRDKRRLIEQLNDFGKAITAYGAEFKALIRAVLGTPEIGISTDTPHKMIIWPVATSESKADGRDYKSSRNAQKTRDEIVVSERISLIEYDEFDNSNDSVRFYPTWAVVT